MKTTLPYQIVRLVIALLGILTLVTSPVSGASPREPFAVPGEALVRLDLNSPADLGLFASTGIEIFARLHSQTGQEYLLLPASPAQHNQLRSLGFTVNVLDSDRRGAGYYLLHARSAGKLEEAGKIARILDRDGGQALAKATPAQAESLSSLGIEIVRLKLHPLVIRERRPTAYPEVIEPNPTIQEMIDQVSSTTVSNYNGGLSGEWAVTIGGAPYTIMTRHTSQATPTEKATQFTYEHFQSLGLPVSYHYYIHPNYGQRRNVVAEQPGLTQPERIFLITAHLDDTSQTPTTYAPGADDNASGSVGVLIAADILSQYTFDCTLRYVLFTGEEQGLWGSYYYAQSAFNNGDNIEGVLNLDMIAYNSDANPILDLHSRSFIPGSTEISNLFVDVVNAYNLPLSPQVLVDNWLGDYSDNASFWDFGYPAILGIEDYDDFTPYYHTTNDRLSTLNLTYFTNFVKAAVGTMAHMGCLPGVLTGEVSNSETGVPVPSANITAQHATGQSRSTLSELDGGYTLSLPEGTYTVTAQANGYVPFMTAGINITSDMTTTLDLPMQPCHISGADFTFSPSNPVSGQTVTFTGTVDASSTAPFTFNWDFGDGHTAQGSVVEHTYTVSDTYTVDMQAQNCAGASSAVHPVTVSGLPGISVSRQSLEIQAEYSQTVTSTLEIGNSGEKALIWSLTELPDAPWLDESALSGELAPRARDEILLTFQAPLAHGIYTTTLQIQSNDPYNPQINIPITLEVVCTAPQQVDFDFTPVNPRLGEPVVFSASASASLPILYTWDFSDGSEPVTGEGLSVVEHSFPVNASQQLYPVTLSVQNACSAPLQTSHNILVSPYQAFLPLVAAASP